MRTAVTRRKSEDSPRNNPTTRVLRLICELIVSHLSEVRSRFLAASGKLKTVNPSGRLTSPQAANCGALLAYSATKAVKKDRADHFRHSYYQYPREHRTRHRGGCDVSQNFRSKMALGLLSHSLLYDAGFRRAFFEDPRRTPLGGTCSEAAPTSSIHHESVRACCPHRPVCL